MDELVKLVILRPTVIDGVHVKAGESVEVDPATARILLVSAYPKAARVNDQRPRRRSKA